MAISDDGSTTPIAHLAGNRPFLKPAAEPLGPATHHEKDRVREERHQYGLLPQGSVREYLDTDIFACILFATAVMSVTREAVLRWINSIINSEHRVE